MYDFEILSTSNESFDDFKIEKIRITHPIQLKNTNFMFVGIDPGTTNVGLAVLDRGNVFTWKIKFLRNPDPVQRMLLTREVLSKCLNFFEYKCFVCIEGASYGKIYRQVELAEIRAACVWWSIEHGMSPVIAQPTEIRKAVFGNGTIKGKEIWKDKLSGDAADALVCAYFSAFDFISR